jgi:hypothetical protein
LALMCLSCGKRDKSETLQKHRTIPPSDAGQRQTLLLSVVEDNTNTTLFSNCHRWWSCSSTWLGLD